MTDSGSFKTIDSNAIISHSRQLGGTRERKCSRSATKGRLCQWYQGKSEIQHLIRNIAHGHRFGGQALSRALITHAAPAITRADAVQLLVNPTISPTYSS